MDRFADVYLEMKTRLDEVRVLTKMAAEYEKIGAMRYREEINAISRGAIVLLCSHLEAYIKELGEKALDSLIENSIARDRLSPRVYYHISKDLLKKFSATSDPEKAANRIFEFIDRDIIYWSKHGPFPCPIEPDRFNRGFANPRFTQIKKYFNRFGYNEYRRDLEAKLRANYRPAVTMVNHLVETRNKIAHGDFSVSMTPSDIKIMTMIIRSFCQTTEQVFGKWWWNSVSMIT